MIDAQSIAADPRLRWLGTMRLPLVAVTPALLAVALVLLAWGAVSERLSAPVPATITVPPITGWHAVPVADALAWAPLHGGSARHVRLRLANARGEMVDLAFALYANQGAGQEAGGFGQGALPLGSHWAWQRPGPAFGHVRGEVIQAFNAASGPEHRVCATWYRSGDLMTGSNLALRLHAMVDHLRLRRRVTAVLILSASDRADRDPAAAIAAFIAAAGPLDRLIDAMTIGKA
jgi:EpsI family protein